MSDLISRSALLKIFNHDLKCFETNGKTEAEMYISVADMRKMINEQPTAYDVDEVVKEVKETSMKWLGEVRTCIVIRAIRKGGVE